jgi:hypothetical protein
MTRARVLSAAAAVLMLPAVAAAQPYLGTGTYSSGQEVPPPPVVASPGTGTLRALLAASGLSLTVDLSYRDMLAPVAGAHIHTGGPGVNGPVAIDFGGSNGFVFGLTAGAYSRVFDLTLAQSYGGTYLQSFGGDVAAARADFVSNFVTSNVYGNLHSSVRPAGEIRANLAVTAVPEPSTYVLMATGLGALGLVARRRRA